MKNKSQILILLILFFCFSLGCLSVILNRLDGGRDSVKNTSPEGSQAPFPDLPSQVASSKRALIIGVEDLRNQDPTLLAIWLVDARLNEKEVDLFGYHLDYSIEGGSKRKLRDMFDFSFETGVNADFIDTITKSMPSDHLDVIIVMDEMIFSSLVDFLGGVRLNDVLLSGDEVIAVQRMLYADADALLSTQAQILDRLRYQLYDLGESVDLTPLFELDPAHRYISEDPEELVLWASPVLPFEPDKIRIEVFTPQDE
jgi:hypothetical protein